MSQNKSLGLVQVVAMAVGTMIGASIFSIFGLGASVAGKELPEAFLLSGVYALAVAYSYAILGSKIISNAGPIAFILKGIGDNLVTGALSVLFWLTYVISIALFAKGFSGYFLPFVHLPVNSYSTNICVAVLIFFFLVLNFFGSKAVGKLELYFVIIKLAILLAFILGGFFSIDWSSVQPEFKGSAARGLLNGSTLFFLSYMGFGLVTNASENMKNAAKNVPRAIYISIAVVLIIYVSISLVTIGNLPLQQIKDAKENALAIAAKPFLGNLGFVLLSVGALFSISSALNATLYGGANIAYSLAKDGELPSSFERKLWFKSTEGLYLTAALGLVAALVLNLDAIASVTSTIYTIIYLFVLISHFRLAKQYGGKRWLIVCNLILLTAVFAALLRYQWNNERTAFFVSLGSFVAALVIEGIYRKVSGRKMEEKQ